MPEILFVGVVSDRVTIQQGQPSSIVMPDLIGHPEVHIGVQEWPHEERGRLDPHFRGGDVDARLLLCLSAPVNYAKSP